MVRESPGTRKNKVDRYTNQVASLQCFISTSPLPLHKPVATDPVTSFGPFAKIQVFFILYMTKSYVQGARGMIRTGPD